MSTGKAYVSVSAPPRSTQPDVALAEDRRRRLAEEGRRRAAEEQRAAEARRIAFCDAEALRTVQQLEARHAGLVEAARRARRTLGTEVIDLQLPRLERAYGQPVPAAWAAAVEEVLQRLAALISEAHSEAVASTVARVDEARRRRAEAEAVERERERVERAADASAGQEPGTSVAAAPAAWIEDARAALDRNVARLADVQDPAIHARADAIIGDVTDLVARGDEAAVDDRIMRLRALVQEVGVARDLAAYQRELAENLRAQLARLDGDDADPTWVGHLDRVALGLEPLDGDVQRRVEEHVVAESIAIALEVQGYLVGDDFTLDMVDGGAGTSWRDEPDHDGHAVRFALLPGSMVDFDLASDASADVEPDAALALERRWCEEDLPDLVRALDAQGVRMRVDERSLPGEREPERVAGLRTDGRRRRSGRSRSRVDQERAREMPT